MNNLIEASRIIELKNMTDIDIIGFTDCKPLLRSEGIINYRNENDMSTEFENKNIKSRLYPKETLKSCKSIITIGMSYNYFKKFTKQYDKNELTGYISRSSLGLDYHIVLRENMEKLVSLINKEKDFEYKIYTDTGPLIDRELAYKSNIGFYGKNCSIINPQYGSFIFLGYILTNLNIIYDIDKKNMNNNYCKDCNLCVKACPTGAIEKPYIINSKKCLSYITQSKNYIREKDRALLGRRLYGCDTCQIVCPINKKASLKKGKSLDLRPKFNGRINLIDLIEISNRQFKRKFGFMAGSWRGKNILKRNAIISLGNIGSDDGLDILYKELEKRDDRFLEYVDWSIMKIKEN